MDFAIQAGELAKTLGLVRGCIPGRTTVPILGHVHIDAKAGAVTLRATDLSIEATASVGADVAVDGSVTVPGDILYGIASRLPKSAMATLAQDGDTVAVTCGRARYALRVLPPEDFPVARNVGNGAVLFSTPARDLLAMLTATRWAMSSEETRFYLCGIHFCVRGDALVTVATDGHRLARHISDLPAGAEGLPPIIIPSNAISQLCGALEGFDGEVSIAATDRMIRVETGSVSIVANLIDGTYPDFERVIPRSNSKTASAAVDDLAGALGRASVVIAGSTGTDPVIKLEAIGDGLAIGVKASQGDNGTEIVAAEISKPGAYAGLNSKYFAGMLSNWPSKNIDIEISDPGAPVLFTASDCPAMTSVIMPRRI